MVLRASQPLSFKSSLEARGVSSHGAPFANASQLLAGIDKYINQQIYFIIIKKLL